MGPEGATAPAAAPLVASIGGKQAKHIPAAIAKLTSKAHSAHWVDIAPVLEAGAGGGDGRYFRRHR